MQHIPKHIAIIPDGNRRWAKERGLQSFQGHLKGFDLILDIGRKAKEMGVTILTIWAFSTENWNRSKEEVNFLMSLFVQKIDEYLKKALEDEIRIIHLGRKDRIPRRLRKKIDEIEEKTSHFSKFYLVIALDYGGRDEILRAFERIKNTEYRIKNLDDTNFNTYLDTSNLPHPNPDLIIRTGGEIRTSGFMAWQATYSEFIFLRKYFPDFSPKDLEECVEEYKKRHRRFGK